MPLCSQAGIFNTHFRGGLSAYGILAGWVRFPAGPARRAPRDPGKEMEDTLGEMLCSVIPIRRNENQRQTGGRARIHLQPQTLHSRRKNTAVHTHLRLYETAGRRWKTSCRDLLKSDWIYDVKAPFLFFGSLFFYLFIFFHKTVFVPLAAQLYPQLLFKEGL